MSEPADRPYHHGNLREALVQAGVELAREGGPDAVQLRAATRAAGVSHNAAYRHFADRDELLAAVSARCMASLAELMERGIRGVRKRDPVAAAEARLNAIGQAYVGFATTEPGWFRTAFGLPRDHVGSSDAEAAGPSGLSPYELLSARLDELVEVGLISAQRRPGLEFGAWSAVHGLAALLVDGPLRTLGPTERDFALSVVLDVVGRGLPDR